MKTPYFCCIGAELKRYEKDFDFMNQVYLYKVPTDDTIDEVFAQDYFKEISSTVLQDDILYIYETAEQKLHICRFNKANGHITAVPLESNVPELEPNRILVSDHNGKIAAGDLSLEYIKDTLSILHCTATLSGTVDTTTVVMLNKLEAFANLDSRPSYKAAGALVIDANGNRGIIESVDTANETAVIVTTFAYNAVVKDSAETQVMQGGLKTPELETDSLIVNGAATFEEAPITNDTTTYQSAASDSLVRKEQVEEVVQDIKTSSLTFIGYVSTTEPDSSVYAFNTGDLWLNSATMPTTFPFAQANIKEWDGTAWVAHSQDYTPANFDFFRNINDNEGYYWFAGQWVVMSTDMSTTYFQLNTVSGKWEIKSSVNLPGSPTTTTPTAGNSSTRIATTKFVADSFAPLASPALTGTPTAPTLTGSSSNNQIVNKQSLEEALANSSSGRNIGDIFYTTRTDTALAGAVECNGGTYNTEDYTGTGSISELLEAGKLPYVPLAQYATLLSTNGVVGVFGWDGGGSIAFRVPTLKDVFIECGQASELGDYIPASIPNLKCSIGESNKYRNDGCLNVIDDGDGFAQTLGNASLDSSDGGSESMPYGFSLNASRVSSVYKDGATTVQPEAIKYRAMVQLFNATTDEAVATVGTVVAQVGTNTSDITSLKNMSNVTATGKATAVGWGMPDYTAGVQITTTAQTAPKNGWIIGFMAYTGSNAAGKIYINDIEISRGSTAAGTTWGNVSVQIPVKAGQTYRYGIDSGASVQQNEMYFYPNNE